MKHATTKKEDTSTKDKPAKAKNLYFMIYKYILRPQSQQRFTEEAPPGMEAKLSDAQNIFYGLFLKDAAPALPIVQSRRGGIDECLPNRVLMKADEVVLLDVSNVKTLKVWEGHDEKEVASHPGCYVIIDNRADVAQMLIERTASFSYNTDAVAAVLQEAINLKLAPYGLEIEIRNKMRSVSFWQMVHRRTGRYLDAVKSVTFHLSHPDKVAGIDADEQAKNRLRVLAYYSAMLHGGKASLLVERQDDQPLHLDQAMEDMAELVSICSKNAFTIEVQFEKYGIYRFGDHEKACLLIPDRALQEFSASEKGDHLFDGYYSTPLLTQLDIARKITEGYEEISINKRRKKSNSEQLQSSPSFWAAAGGAH